MTKPRLVFYQGLWYCTAPYTPYGFGFTKEQAFAGWWALQ